jgi:hypothetical protein
MAAIELSYQELQGLEVHCRRFQNEAGVRTLKPTPVLALQLFEKVLKRKPASGFLTAHPVEDDHRNIDKPKK